MNGFARVLDAKWKGGTMEMQQFITVKQVAGILRLSQPTVYRLLKKKNGIPVHRIGGSWRFIEKEVIQWAGER
jgi:excisionase family DNA binding protein